VPEEGNPFASLGLGAILIKSMVASHGESLRIESVRARGRRARYPPDALLSEERVPVRTFR
jgi:hypothetical protein